MPSQRISELPIRTNPNVASRIPLLNLDNNATEAFPISALTALLGLALSSDVATALADKANSSSLGALAFKALVSKTDLGASVKIDDLHEMLESFYDRLGPKKNLLKKSLIRPGFYFSPANDVIQAGATYRVSPFIEVTPGDDYTISGVRPSSYVAAFVTASDTGSNTELGQADGTGKLTVTIPSGHHYLVVNITDNSSTSYDNTAQVEEGTEATDYEDYVLVFRPWSLPDFASPDDLDAAIAALRAVILEQVSDNLINPAVANFSTRHSKSQNKIVTDTEGIARTALIPVEEGVTYTFSGPGIYTDGSGPQGGFYAAGSNLALNTVAIQNVDFASTLGGGWAFTVPEGLGIGGVVLSLWKTGHVAGGTTIDGNVQLEEGEVATTYQPYALYDQIKPSLLPDSLGSSSDSGSATLDAEAWYRFVLADEGGATYTGKLPDFRAKWLSRNADLCVVNTGTSLTARSTEHCSVHPQATSRPPLMHSLNFASHIWDRLRWEGQVYRRYDFAGFFSETGVFATSHNQPEWDDGAYRNGLTRYSSTANAAVAFTLPAGAWACRFIDRTDSVGCTATITVAEGNGRMEVWNGSAWVEANGYSFSQAEAAPATRSITMPNPNSGGTSVVVAASKSNTTYQRRIKMRSTSAYRTVAKTITIGRTGGGARFMYWGVEWSVREHMVTYINAARGSHKTDAMSAAGLPRFADNEVWSFQPDLMLFELPIHNDGADDEATYPADYWERLTENFVFKADYELSMVGAPTRLGIPVPEIAMFTASTTYDFGGISEAGELEFAAQGGGQVMSALDKWHQVKLYVEQNYPDAICVNVAQRWVTAAVAIYGDLKTATATTGKTGPGMTNDQGHWNDVGSRIAVKPVLPVLNFTA